VVHNPTNNELTNILGSWSYSYDGNGNLRAKTQGTTTWAYTRDSANRLVKASSNNVLRGAYAYDGIGRRGESVESSTTFYAYYGTETLSELISGGATTDYLSAGGLRIGRLSDATVNYYHADALGSTRLLTSATKTVQFSDNYQPFGEDNGTPYCSGNCEKYKITGKPVSARTGLYYYFHRWYDPSVGRFISPDPRSGKLSNPQSLNLYIYVLDQPTSLVDPSGESQCPSERDSHNLGSLGCKCGFLLVVFGNPNAILGLALKSLSKSQFLILFPIVAKRSHKYRLAELFGSPPGSHTSELVVTRD